MIRPGKDAKPREKKQYALFMKRTGSIFQTMRQRRKKLAETATGDLPFALEEFRSKIELALGKPCFFCNELITLKNFSADHRLPAERGGSWRLTNIRIVCKACNGAKGRMTEHEFCLLMNTLFLLKPKVRREVLGRLKAGASVIRLRFIKR